MTQIRSRSKSWKQQTTKVVYENPWIRVNHDTVITPSSTEGIYGVVHFKNHAIGILPVDEQGYTWLVSQSRYVMGEISWEIPEGGCPVGELKLEAAKRELREETGLSAIYWQEWLCLDLSNSVTDEQATIYLAGGLSEGECEPEVTEDIQVKKLPIWEAIDMVLSGEITDAMSVAALMKYAATYER